MPKTMKLTDVGSTEEKVQRYIEDADWVMQQKFDGTRVVATYDPVEETIHWSNDGVKNLTHAAAKLKVPALEDLLKPALFRLGRKIALDGELLIRTGEFLLWDFLDLDQNGDVMDYVWFDRHNDLQRFFDILKDYRPGQELVKITPTAWSLRQKEVMWDSVKEANVEGAVSKRVDSLYLPGVRSKEWVKHKLTKTADLVVVKTRRNFKPGSLVVKEGSATLAVSEAGMAINICSASLIGKDLTIAEGDVVEVAYLYREPGVGGLVQPRIIKKRWDAQSGTGDKRPEECGLDQFPEYSRSVVSLEAGAI